MRINYIKTYLVIISVLVLRHATQAQEIMDEKKVLELTLQNNYNIELAKNSSKIAENNVSLGNAGMLPTIGLDGNVNRNNNLRFEATNQADSTFVLTNVRSSSYGIDANLNWVLFDGTKMFVTYGKLKSINEQANWESKSVIENVLSQSLSAYYLLVNEKSKVSVLQDALALSKERLEIAKEKYDLGNFSRSEYLAAKVDFNTDYSALLIQQSVLKSAQVNLNVLLGRSAEKEMLIADSAIKINKYFEIEKARNKLRSDNYQLIASRIGLQIAMNETDEIRSELLPELALQATTGIGGSQNPVGFLRTTNTSSLNYGLTASWRIFDGFNRNRRQQNAIINEQNQQVTINSLQNELLGQLETQYVLYQNRTKLIDLELNNVEVAKENVALALERYKLGRSNSLDLREAQLNAIQAAGRLLNALYEAKMAEINILRITGTTIAVE